MKNLFDNQRNILILFVLIASGLLALFALVSSSAGQGHLLMPLDDVYIHFQYAKQMALGQPYVYNTGQPATSGATSFLYPYLLAVGYVIGFKGLWLGLWAMLIGTAALIASQWTVYRIMKALDCPDWLSILAAASFALTGSIAWHFMSGMETGLMIALTLYTLLMVIEKRFRGFIIAATLLSMMRPEGGVLSIIAAGTMFLRLWSDFGAHEKRSGKRHLLLLLAIPVLAIGVQPLVNLMMTGSTVATGNQAKSILATVPHDWRVIIGRIVENFVRMWWQFITGYDWLEGRGWYLPPSTGIVGLIAIVCLLFKRNYRLVGLMLLGWLLASTAAVSTLDTAFWHFKRYQMPMMALFFPLTAWLLSETVYNLSIQPVSSYKQFEASVTRFTIAVGLPLFAFWILIQFVAYHRLNVGYVYQQPYQMALWLRENTPEDAVIAVHDVGMMRYMGERNTLDMVGLTTPDAAAYWRNGPGSVAEFLINQQPDYIASYGRGHGYGLAYLADTSLYGEPLASFPIENWDRQANVALAADFQGIYQPDWEQLRLGIGRIMWNLDKIIPHSVDLLSFVDVANLESENLAHYSWSENGQGTGFPSQIQELTSLVDTPCDSIQSRYCTTIILESGRVVDESERFNIVTSEHARMVINSENRFPLVLATLVQVVDSEQVDVYVNNTFVATRMIPNAPGRWHVILTEIPPHLLNDPLWIEIIPHHEGRYIPYYHALYEYNGRTTEDVSNGVADFSTTFYLEYINPLEDIRLRDVNSYVRTYLSFDIRWFAKTQPEGDYRFFIHLYNDINQPPVLQWDGYFAGMPVGNWLRGSLQDRIELNVARRPGTYQVAIGFYNPNDPTDRLVPTSDVYEVSPDGRLWLGEITIE